MSQPTARFSDLSSLEAEQSVIGACLLKPKLIDRLIDRVKAHDFVQETHQMLWREMNRLTASGQTVDLLTLSDALSDAGQLQAAGGMGYLADITRSTPTAENAEAYANIVADLSNRRRLLETVSQVQRLAHDKRTPFTDVIDSAQGSISRLVRADAGEIGPIGQFLDQDLISPLEKRQSGEFSAMGMSFGLPDLDARTLGMHPEQLVVVGARPGMGKTAMSLTALVQCAIHDKRPAVMFSMEMGRASLLQRLTAQIGDIPIQAIRDPKNHLHDEHYPRLTHAVNQLKDAPLVIDDRAALTPSQIRGAAKRWRDYYGDLGLVVVDYLGLMKPDGRHGTREQEVAEMSGAMKALAKELKVPVMLLSQLNRGLESRTDKRPLMSDLRESGSVEQDADIIVFLYRHERYFPDDEQHKGVMELIVSKQREGDTGTEYAAARLANARIQPLDATTITQIRNPPLPELKRRPRSAMEVI
ncbi:MAG: replicative DNA helicase [Halomonas sp.]|uniref:replicative DNA helicase n=1 Tax=Halomonas sp. TaxID=1486246 RepID=UPI003F8E0A2F